MAGFLAALSPHAPWSIADVARTPPLDMHGRDLIPCLVLVGAPPTQKRLRLFVVADDATHLLLVEQHPTLVGHGIVQVRVCAEWSFCIHLFCSFSRVKRAV
jgi:hypothetical protein